MMRLRYSRPLLLRSLRQRLEESESKRRVIQERSLAVQKEWEEKLAAHNSGAVQKQAARIKGLESVVEEQADSVLLFSGELARIKSENFSLKQKLDDAGRKIDELDNNDEHTILRQQLESLLKEKTALSLENQDYRKKLGIADEKYHSAKKPDLTIDTSKTPKRQTNDPMTPTAGDKKGIDSLALPLTQDDIELRSKVVSYFERKYPNTKVNQVNRSRIQVTQIRLASIRPK